MNTRLSYPTLHLTTLHSTGSSALIEQFLLYIVDTVSWYTRIIVSLYHCFTVSLYNSITVSPIRLLHTAIPGGLKSGNNGNDGNNGNNGNDSRSQACLQCFQARLAIYWINLLLVWAGLCECVEIKGNIRGILVFPTRLIQKWDLHTLAPPSTVPADRLNRLPCDHYCKVEMDTDLDNPEF